MSPEERAAIIVKRYWNTDRPMSTMGEEIATAIKAAVVTERAACAQLAWHMQGMQMGMGTSIGNAIQERAGVWAISQGQVMTETPEQREQRKQAWIASQRTIVGEAEDCLRGFADRFTMAEAAQVVERIIAAIQRGSHAKQ